MPWTMQPQRAVFPWFPDVYLFCEISSGDVLQRKEAPQLLVSTDSPYLFYPSVSPNCVLETPISRSSVKFLEKEMAAHSSVLAWRIPGRGEPGGLPSMGSHRVGHD